MGMESPGKARNQYEYFYDRRIRRDIYELSKEFADYLFENKIANIIFLDSSARAAYVGVDEFWNEYFPEVDKPGFYFVNPTGFKVTPRTLELAPGEATSLFTELQSTGALPARANRTLEDVKNRFLEVFTKLTKDKDKPLVVFDTCLHTGSSVQPILDVLKEAGFSDVKVVAAMSHDRESEIAVDTTLDNHTYFKTCNPFGVDDLVKRNDDVLSVKVKDGDRQPGYVADGPLVRQEIRNIIKDEGR